jgi:hypothetical protein
MVTENSILKTIHVQLEFRSLRQLPGGNEDNN